MAADAPHCPVRAISAASAPAGEVAAGLPKLPEYGYNRGLSKAAQIE